MARTIVVVVGVSAIVCALFAPRAALAQQATASGIAGLVKDASGAVLPGVTVEATSPALIERARTAVTDSDGRYNIVDLRPGTYAVTFTLAGFSTFKRDGIELPSGFTATVNADMQIGALTETITVSGQSPLVDTRTARKQTLVSSDLLNALPSSVKNMNNLVTLTPGFRGNEGFDVTGGYTGQVGATYHGKGGTNVAFDGMGIQHSQGNQGYNQNQEIVQETVLSISGISADNNSDGVQINLVPKEGGNTFRGSVSGLYSGTGLQSDNLTDSLRARGLTTVTTVNYIFDSGFTLGGPIKKDTALVLSLVSGVGQRAPGCRQVLQHDARHDVLHPRPRSAGVRSRVVRVQSHARDMAGVGAKQVQLLRRSPARLPLPGECGERKRQRAGVVFQLSPPPGRAVSGHLERAVDQ